MSEETGLQIGGTRESGQDVRSQNVTVSSAGLSPGGIGIHRHHAPEPDIARCTAGRVRRGEHCQDIAWAARAR